jgi:hypothetical protein
MQLQVGDLVIPVRVRDRSQTRSRHSGAELEVVTGEVELAGDDEHQRFYSAVTRGSRRFLSVPEEGAPQVEWEVQVSQYSRTGRQYTYSLKLTQFEALNVHGLELDTIPVKPYRYEESVAGDTVTADAWVRVSATERQQLLDLHEGPAVLQGRSPRDQRPAARDALRPAELVT